MSALPWVTKSTEVPKVLKHPGCSWNQITVVCKTSTLFSVHFLRLTRRICRTIKSSLNMRSPPTISWPQNLIQGCYCWEKLDAVNQFSRVFSAASIPFSSWQTRPSFLRVPKATWMSRSWFVVLLPFVVYRNLAIFSGNESFARGARLTFRWRWRWKSLRWLKIPTIKRSQRYRTIRWNMRFLWDLKVVWQEIRYLLKFQMVF